MRIQADMIRYRDKYRVYRKGMDTIRVEWVCDGNVSFPPGEPYEVLVSGWASRFRDSRLDDKIATLGMVVSAIVQEANMENMPNFEGFTKEDEYRKTREWIEKHMDILPRK